jgi:hypothetical protein
MISVLARIISSYHGDKNRVRCFAHIINLIVKVILRQFDSRQRKKSTDGTAEDDEIDEMAEEEAEMDEGGDVDSDEGLDELEGSVESELKALEAGVKPIRNVLTKVSSCDH